MRHRISSILVFTLLALKVADAQSALPSTATAANSAPADARKTEVIRQIIEVSNSGDLLKQVIDSQLPETMAVLRRNPLFPPAFLDQIQAQFSVRLKEIDLAELAIPVYSKHFTLEELQQILAFYQSPTGQKIARLESAIYSEVAADAQAKGREIGKEITREILAAHPEYVRQMQENRRKLQSQVASPASFPPGSVYPIGNGVAPPRLASRQEPQYTPEAIQAKINGSVLLSIVIDEAGVPRNIRVIRPLGFGLDEKAVEAVQQWRFEPGTKDGKPVVTAANVEVNFRLLPNAPPPPPPSK